MRPDTKAEGKRWLAQAERDGDDAAFAFEGKRYHLVCLRARQACEKALKPCLYTQGAEEA